MKGKQIAENLRQNRDKWTIHNYHNDGKYCVIGLKLHELGVPVENWDEERQGYQVAILAPLPEEKMYALTRLQRANDSSKDVDNLISWLEGDTETDYPLEELAEALKVQAGVR